MNGKGKHLRRQTRVPLERVDEYTWRIPRKYKPGMRVPGIVFADEDLLKKMTTDRTLEQCANVAHLPGIYKHSITLPDGHEGYGFPIGGVAATDYDPSSPNSPTQSSKTFLAGSAADAKTSA